MAARLGAFLVAGAVALGAAQSFPDPKSYADDPVLYAQERLGISTLWDRQIEFLEAVRDYDRVSYCGAHKLSKSYSFALLAAWWYETREDARVVMSSTTARQVNAVLWREFRRMVARTNKRAEAGECAPILGRCSELPANGLKSEDPADPREVCGYTARDAESAAGTSSANVLYLLDESTGIDDAIFEAFDGNAAGGAKIVMASNPTKTTGRFYESQTNKTIEKIGPRGWKALQVSALESPNVKAGRKVIPGLATLEWIERMSDEYGEDSPQFIVRVLGKFVHGQDGQAIPIHLTEAGCKAWHDCDEDPEHRDDGRLAFGLDPAGDGVGGDAQTLAHRRGMRVLSVAAKYGQTERQLADWVIESVRAHRRPREPKPRVTIDAGGPIGARVCALLQAHLDLHPDAFELIELRAEKVAWGNEDCHTVRAALWWDTRKFLEAGGAIPDDAKLTRELNTPALFLVKGKDNAERYDVTDKKVMKKTLGRSPDRADACNLACWQWRADDDQDDEVEEVTSREASKEKQGDNFDDDVVYDDPRGLDPYARWGGS